jgi:hypothetical protein
MHQLFHECVDGEDWILTSSYSPDECRDRLRGVLRSWYVRTGHDSYFNMPILGSVEDETFRAKVGGHQGVFAAYGRLSPSSTGTTIAVEISHTFAAWGEVGLLAIIVLVLLLKALPTPTVWEAISFLISAAALIAVPLHWHWEKHRLIDFIRSALDATPTQKTYFSPSLDL